MIADLMGWARKLYAIIVNTIRESTRSRVLGTLLFVAVLLISGSLILAEMSLQTEIRVIRDFSFFVTALFSVLISVYTAVTLLHTEFEDRTIYNILSKPVRRWEFLIGKVLGLEVLVAGVITFLGLATWGTLAYYGAQMTWPTIWAYAMLMGQVSIIIAIAVFFSTFSSSLLSGVFAFVIFIAGNFQNELQQMREYLLENDSPYLAELVGTVRVVIPDLQALNLSEEITYSVNIPTEYLTAGVGYSFSYSAVVLVLAMASFHFKEIE